MCAFIPVCDGTLYVRTPPRAFPALRRRSSFDGWSFSSACSCLMNPAVHVLIECVLWFQVWHPHSPSPSFHHLEHPPLHSHVPSSPPPSLPFIPPCSCERGRTLTPNEWKALSRSTLLMRPGGNANKRWHSKVRKRARRGNRPAKSLRLHARQYSSFCPYSTNDNTIKPFALLLLHLHAAACMLRLL